MVRNMSVSSRKCMLLICILIIGTLTGCGSGKSSTSYGLSADDPVQISMWLSGSEKRQNAYKEMIKLFNETEGASRGIQVSTFSYEDDAAITDAFHSLTDAEGKKSSAAEKSDKDTGKASKESETENGSKLPNMLAVTSGSELLYEKSIDFVDINDLIAKSTKEEIFESLIYSGTIGRDNNFRLLPVVKDTTVLAADLNKWNAFKADKEHYLNELNIWEGLSVVGETYHQSTGMSLYGIESVSEYMMAGSRQLGSGLISIENGNPVIRTDGGVMKTLWENYYVSFITGGMFSHNKKRLKDLQDGYIAIAAIRSSETSELGISTATEGDAFYMNEYQILPYPQFKNHDKICPVDTSGVALIHNGEKEDMASIIFLEWMLQAENNMHLACLAGGIPVNKKAANPQFFEIYLDNHKTGMSEMEVSTMRIALEMTVDAEVYAPPLIKNYGELVDYLESSMTNEAHKDRDTIDDTEAIGNSRKTALEKYTSDEHFGVWINEFKSQIPQN